jgi:hypothetical protein
MNRTGGPPELWRMRWPRMGLLAIVASIALLTAACSGSPAPGNSGGTPAVGSASSSPDSGGSSSPGRSATQQKQLAYSECMRAHGVPDVPTSMPSVKPGTVPSSDVSHWSPVKASGPNPGSPQFEAAQQACHSPYSDAEPQPG